jgi:hypothetical protein
MHKHSSAKTFGDSQKPQEHRRRNVWAHPGKGSCSLRKVGLPCQKMKARRMPLAIMWVPRVCCHAQQVNKPSGLKRTLQLDALAPVRRGDTSCSWAPGQWTSKKEFRTYFYISKFREYVIKVAHELHEMFCDLARRQPGGVSIGATSVRTSVSSVRYRSVLA